MPSAASPSLPRTPRRRSRRSRRALMAALIMPLAFAGSIHPAAAAVMRYSFSGNYSRTPKTNFDWLVGARLEGTMDWDTETGAFTSWDVTSYRTDWQQLQESLGPQTNPRIVSQIRDLQARLNYINKPESLSQAIDQANKDLEKADPELKRPIEIKIQALELLKNDLDKGSDEKRQKLKGDTELQIVELNEAQIRYLQTKIAYIQQPELIEQARAKAEEEQKMAEEDQKKIEDNLNGSEERDSDLTIRRPTLEEQRESAIQDLANAKKTIKDLDTLKRVIDSNPQELEKALKNDLQILSLSSAINYLDNPEFLNVALAKAEASQNQERLVDLTNLKKDIVDIDASKLRNSFQRELNALRANQGLSGLSAEPRRPEILINLNSADPGSFCFTSPVGPGSALAGGSFNQGEAGTSLCDGKNGGMTDASFTEDQNSRNPLYFSVIQYYQIPESDQKVSFGFRLAFVPGDQPEVLLGNQLLDSELSEPAETAYESQPWYGTTFRFGGQQGLVDGSGECHGNADGPEVVASNGGVTTACPFTPDESGEVAGQTFLAGLTLTLEANKSPGGGGTGGSGGGGVPVGGGGGPVGGGSCDPNSSCPVSQTPGPLPIAGAGAAFAWSRRVRRRHTLVPAKAPITA